MMAGGLLKNVKEEIHFVRFLIYQYHNNHAVNFVFSHVYFSILKKIELHS